MGARTGRGEGARTHRGVGASSAGTETRRDSGTLGFGCITRGRGHAPGRTPQVGYARIPRGCMARAGCPCLCPGMCDSTGSCTPRPLCDSGCAGRVAPACGGRSTCRLGVVGFQRGRVQLPGRLECSWDALLRMKCHSTLSSAWYGWAGCKVGAGDPLPVPPISREHCSVAVRLHWGHFSGHKALASSCCAPECCVLLVHVFSTHLLGDSPPAVSP